MAEDLINPSLLSSQQFEELKNKLNLSGELWLRASGKSMFPLIKENDLIQLLPYRNKSKVSYYDIIVFFNERILVCHYVHHINRTHSPTGGKTYVTKGISKSYEDFPILDWQILGYVSNFKLNWFLKIKIRLRLIGSFIRSKLFS